MTENNPNPVAEIWKDDLLGRQAEADMLIAYIESVYKRTQDREDGRAYTIAIDAPYGEGKSFFLRRLAEQLKINHPVAFVDAWSDDIADEPLTALASTLKNALEPMFETNQVLDRQWKSVIEKTGKIAMIAAKGLTRRAITFAITAGGLESVDAVLDGSSESIKEAAKEAVKQTADDIGGDSDHIEKLISKNHLMNSRISEFEDGVNAIKGLKSSLMAIVNSVKESNLYPPIIIIIDELDRCRPTYSVKCLEEIKHLFDVNGLVFILGLNGSQLSNSLSHAYGSNFDGV